MAKYFVKMEDSEELMHLASVTLGSPFERRGSSPYVSERGVLIADMEEDDVAAMENSGAQVFEDIEFDHLSGQAEYWEPAPTEAAPAVALGLPDVLEQIRAPDAWATTRGRGVNIAVVDTGICDTLQEFPVWKRSSLDLQSAYAGHHWKDSKGHGSMCATIAAGAAAHGGRFNGVAPEATVISARSTLLASDIYTIYDELLNARANEVIEGPLVISNSYGLYTCSPPLSLPVNHPYLDIVLAAIDDGVPVVFAAGNNHYDVKCNHNPAACQPNSIWAVNSHDRVLSVGTVNQAETNQDPSTPHANSSRGPGQWAQEYLKPDCVAPTYGEVVWGCGYRVMDWWGTSGACPQVAGLAALILAVNPLLSPHEVAEIIRNTCRALTAAPTCVGRGIIDCAAAVSAAESTP
jgi:subtilisin family serine protease